jgi:hypothetical protein
MHLSLTFHGAFQGSVSAFGVLPKPVFWTSRTTNEIQLNMVYLYIMTCIIWNSRQSALLHPPSTAFEKEFLNEITENEKGTFFHIS